MTGIRRLPATMVPVALLCGCATSLSATHRAKVLGRGDWEIVTGYGANLPVGAVWTAGSEIIDAGKAAAGEIRQAHDCNCDVKVDEAKAKRAGVAAALLVAQPPSFTSPEVTVRVGLGARLEAGFRYSGPALRGELAGQLIDGGDTGWDVGLVAGYQHHTFDGWLLEVLDTLNLASFSRDDFDAALIVGKSWKAGSFYFGPKLQYQRFSADGLLAKDDKVVVPGVDGRYEPLEISLGRGFVYGGVIGGRVGWKYVFFTTELGVYGSDFKPRVAGETYDLGGLIVYPAIGLVANW